MTKERGLFPLSFFPHPFGLISGRLLTTALVGTGLSTPLGLLFSVKLPCCWHLRWQPHGAESARLSLFHPGRPAQGWAQFLWGKANLHTTWVLPMTSHLLHNYLPVCGTEWLSWSPTWWEIGFELCCRLLFCMFTFWEEKPLSDFCPVLFPERDSRPQTQLWGLELIMPPVSQLGFVQCTSHCPFGSLFIKLYHICLAPFFMGCEILNQLMKNTGNTISNVLLILSSLGRLDEGMCIFVQTFALDRFCIVFMYFKYTFPQICI